MDRIGQGGVAVVYRARDERLGRIVALKVLREHLAADPEFQVRFQREARIAASLSHRNIVGVHDYGAYGDAAFIAMDFVDGVTLKERIRALGRLPVAEAVGIARAVLSALEYAHARGVVHRDVKPQNVMIDRQGEAKLTDFGIARAAEASGLTRTGSTIGSAAYMAPEQARGEAVGPTTDVYGAGLLLYEMLVGRPPFEGEALVPILYRQLNEPPTPPSTLGVALPPGLEAALLRASRRRRTSASPAPTGHGARAGGRSGPRRGRARPATWRARGAARNGRPDGAAPAAGIPGAPGAGSAAPAAGMPAVLGTGSGAPAAGMLAPPGVGSAAPAAGMRRRRESDRRHRRPVLRRCWEPGRRRGRPVRRRRRESDRRRRRPAWRRRRRPASRRRPGRRGPAVGRQRRGPGARRDVPSRSPSCADRDRRPDR